MKLIIFALVALFDIALGYSGGAPSAACMDLTPQHGPDPQDGTSGIMITTSSWHYDSCDSEITGKVKSKKCTEAGMGTIIGQCFVDEMSVFAIN